MMEREDHARRPGVERISVVRTLDDFLRVAAVRSIVYIADQRCPYDEEFDGNDFCGIHLIGWSGDEPAACLRIRFFASFAKLERLAVRPEFRQSSLAFRIVRFGLQIAVRKGYRTAYGHAQEGLEPFWARFGARPAGPVGAFAFSGRRYTEMIVDLPSSSQAIALGTDPLVTIRPEGEWDRPGILERGRSGPPVGSGAVSITPGATTPTSEALRARLKSDFQSIAIRRLMRNGLPALPRSSIGAAA